jgi:hypothetical protein
LRQHERVTEADRLLQEELRRFDRSAISLPPIPEWSSVKLDRR